MHPNLEKRFVELEVARTTLEIKRIAFASRFRFLFDALVAETGITAKDMADNLGWNPYPLGGNAISLGNADPSPEDCYRLLDVYLGWIDTVQPKPARCEVCSWPLKDDPRDGCTKGNCSMRPVLEAGQRVAEIFQ